MSREWKPGDVARVQLSVDRTTHVAEYQGRGRWQGSWNGFSVETEKFASIHPLVVIDAEDREQVERLWAAYERDENFSAGPDGMRSALREFANPTQSEPTNPAARVTDRRENIWRLLADGDWVCISGPDIGEYLNWDQLAGDRGPVTVEVTP